MAAVSSMRLLVVAGLAPLISSSLLPNRSRAAQPPGPGLPRQAPSVKISTRSPGSPLISAMTASALDAIGGRAAHLAMEFQLLPVFQRVLWLDHGAGHLVEPVIPPGQQKAQGRAAGEQWRSEEHTSE